MYTAASGGGAAAQTVARVDGPLAADAERGEWGEGCLGEGVGDVNRRVTGGVC